MGTWLATPLTSRQEEGGYGGRVAVVLPESREKVTAESDNEEDAVRGLRRRSDTLSGRVKGPGAEAKFVRQHSKSVGMNLRREQLA